MTSVRPSRSGTMLVKMRGMQARRDQLHREVCQVAWLLLSFMTRWRV